MVTANTITMVVAEVANDNAVTSWVPEVLVGGHWSASGVRFATKADCERYGRLLLMRWFVPDDSRATASNDPVNYRLNEDGSISAVETNDEVAL